MLSSSDLELYPGRMDLHPFRFDVQVEPAAEPDPEVEAPELLSSLGAMRRREGSNDAVTPSPMKVDAMAGRYGVGLQMNG